MCTGAEPEAAAAATEGAKGAGEVAATEAGATATATEAGAASMPAAMAETGGATAVEAGAAGTSGATTGSDVLGTIKTLAPAVSAGANLIGAGAAYAQAQAAKNAPVPKPGGIDKAQLQVPVDPNLAEIRKRNALLFGLDSPTSTDLTKGSAGTTNLGRVTLLGG